MAANVSVNGCRSEHQGFITSLASSDLMVVTVELLLSRNRLGVRLILRVSVLSSLKKESVFLTVPFLDLAEGPSSTLVSDDAIHDLAFTYHFDRRRLPTMDDHLSRVR